MLDVQRTQVEPQYLGSSSAFAFSHLINPSLRCAIAPKTSQQGGMGQIEISPTPCPLPEYTTARTLSNAYFENIHPQYPFLHEPTFRRYEECIMGVPSETGNISMLITSTAPLFFLNMVRKLVSLKAQERLTNVGKVYAVGAFLVPGYRHLAEVRRLLQATNKRLTLGAIQQLYSSAQLYPDVLSHDNLEAIQAILCYAMYSLRSATGPSLWYVARSGSRDSC